MASKCSEIYFKDLLKLTKNQIDLWTQLSKCMCLLGQTGTERYATTQPKSALQSAELLRARVKSDKNIQTLLEAAERSCEQPLTICPASSCNGVFLIDSFKDLREQRLKEKEEEQEKLLQLQNGQVSLSAADEEGPPEKIMGLDLSTWEGRSSQQQEGSLSSHGQADARQEEGAKSEEGASAAQLEAPASVPTDAVVVVRERSQTLDEPGQKTTRAKRESRRMRELEQAKFSLELLKVRTTVGGPSSPSEERRWSLELVPPSPPFRSPQGTPDSQSSKGSFELLDLDEEPPKAVEEALDSEEFCSPPPEAEVESGSSDAGPTQMEPAASSSAASHPPKIENYLPTFYVPGSGGSADISCRPAEEPRQTAEASVFSSETVTRPLKERREAMRRPVVVVISMQKETPLKERLHPPAQGPDSAAQTRESAPSPRKRNPAPALAGPVPTPTSTNPASQIVMEKLVRLNEEKEVRRRSQQQQNEKEMMEQIRQQKEELERQRLFFAQYERDMFEKQRGEALQKIQQSRQQQDRRAPRSGPLLVERGAGLAPHGRVHSNSAPQPSHLQEQKAPPQLPPPPASAPRERRRPAAEGWAPKLTLESREGVASRARAANRKPASAVSLTDKPGNIFFSPKDKVTFAK